MVDTTTDAKTLAQHGMSLHQQGRLAEAEQIYLQVIRDNPTIVGPRYLLGVLRMQQNRHREAAELMAPAAKASPEDVGVAMNYGMALRAAGRPADALENFRRVAQRRPDLAEAHYNAGVALADLTRFEEAIESYERTLVLRPDFIMAWGNRGVALAAVQRFDDALASYDKVLAVQPMDASAHYNRGLVLVAVGKSDAAMAAFDMALSAAPGFHDAAYQRGVMLLRQGRFADALAAFEPIAASRPQDGEIHSNISVALWNLGRPSEALVSADKALGVEPRLAAALLNRALALRDLGRHSEALASLDQAVALAPGHAAAWNNRGSVLRDLKRFEEAIESFSRAIAIRSDYSEALNNRGYAWWADRQEYALALADLERALALDPDHAYLRGEVLHLKMYGADWADYDAQKAVIETGIRAGKRVARPFMFQAVSQSPADLQACSRIWAADRFASFSSAPHQTASRKARGKIRLGYLSGEFRDQATQILMAGIYDLHDREKFELVALDNGASDGSPMRARLEKAFDQWIDISAMPDEGAAAKIREAEIDILVNLNGYFGKPRMGVFARRPAPVQVNYLGFPATLGAPYMDYIIADKVVIPEGERKFYDEQVVWLPGSYQPNDNLGRPIGEAPSRIEAGLPIGAFVFCNFNNAYKLTPDTFAGWMRILRQVDSSVLWLLESQAPFADNLRRAAEAAGVAASRILFAPEKPPAEHLARLGLADLFLDSLPYNAHTTASDALWAGVPLLTRRGSAFPGRVAASLLMAAGMDELVTQTQDAYEALAVALAGDAARLAGLRARLKANRDTCALFDTQASCRNLESAYRTMWENWLSGAAPKPFSV